MGGDQIRPNIHIEDITDLYVQMMEYPKEKIHKKIFNAGYENHKVSDIAQMVSTSTETNAKINVVLNYPVTWSASHIAGHGKNTWAEVATFNPEAQTEKEQ